MTKFEPESQKKFNEPDVVGCLFHDKRQQILSVLVEKEMTVYGLKTALKMNPGVVKRHIDSLLEHGLIKQTRRDQNKMGMTLKYYRAVAMKYVIFLEWEKP